MLLKVGLFLYLFLDLFQIFMLFFHKTMTFYHLLLQLLYIMDPIHEKYNRNVILYIDLLHLFYLKNIAHNV
jgi:succinate dehydrogenase/fumarate reductase cytochrome b subunit